MSRGTNIQCTFDKVIRISSKLNVLQLPNVFIQRQVKKLCLSQVALNAHFISKGSGAQTAPQHGIDGLMRVTFHLQGPAIASDRAGLHTFIVQRAERFKFCSALPYKFICKYKKSRKESTILLNIYFIYFHA